jgi:hypothetical protein
MKKGLSAILALVTILTLTACSGGDERKYTFDENTMVCKDIFTSGYYTTDSKNIYFSDVDFSSVKSLPVYEITSSDENISPDRAKKILDSLDDSSLYKEMNPEIAIKYDKLGDNGLKTGDGLSLSADGSFILKVAGSISEEASTFASTLLFDKRKGELQVSDSDMKTITAQVSAYIKAHEDIFGSGYDEVLYKVNQPRGNEFIYIRHPSISVTFFKKAPETAEEVLLYLADCYESISFTFSYDNNVVINYESDCTGKKLADVDIISHDTAKSVFDKAQYLAVTCNDSYTSGKAFSTYIAKKPSKACDEKEPYPTICYAPMPDGSLVPVYMQMRECIDFGEYGNLQYYAVIPAIK